MQNKSQIDTLDNLVKALCADYGRREKIIMNRDAERRVDNEMRYLNFKIFDAVSEIVGEARAPMFISEIAGSVGYAKSSVDCMGEGMYKRYKSLVKKNIAKKLYLV